MSAKSEKTAYLCRFFFVYTLFCYLYLRNGCVGSANEYWLWGWVLIRCWLFHCWWIFLRRWMFLWGGAKGWRSGLVWFDWVRGWLGIGGRCSSRALMRAPVLGVLFFAVTSVTADGIENTSSSQKRRIVLLKTTCHFIENNVLFCGKWRVVLDWRSKGCFEDGVLGSFWGGVAAWKCDSAECCFWNQCKWLLHNEL